jgi:hypothetical protein
MQTTSALRVESPPAGTAMLWARAAQLVDSLVAFLGPASALLTATNVTSRERREIGLMLAPAEALVRSLLMSDAIAWLKGTDEGETMLREAAHAARLAQCEPQPSSHAAATHASPQACVHPDDPDIPPEIAPESEQACEQETAPTEAADAACAAISDSEAASLLAPEHLAFALQEPCEWNRARRPSRNAPARPRRTTRRRRKRPHPNLALARRYEALCRVCGDPQAARLALARDLATSDLGNLYVPSPRNWIDERWQRGREEVRHARAISFVEFCAFVKARSIPQALPPPDPG